MNERFNSTIRMARAVVAVVAAALLLSGAAWRGWAAGAQPATVQAATLTTPLSHAGARRRHSYADIVDVVSPPVVTIPAGESAAVSTTGLPCLCAWQLGHGQSRRCRARGRQPAQRWPDRDAGDHQRQGPIHRDRRWELRGLPAD